MKRSYSSSPCSKDNDGKMNYEYYHKELVKSLETVQTCQNRSEKNFATFDRMMKSLDIGLRKVGKDTKRVMEVIQVAQVEATLKVQKVRTKQMNRMNEAVQSFQTKYQYHQQNLERMLTEEMDEEEDGKENYAGSISSE